MENSPTYQDEQMDKALTRAGKLLAAEVPYSFSDDHAGIEALRRLIEVAQGCSGQSGHVAAFLLAWWNADEHGGFDLTRIWAVDANIAKDMIEVFGLIQRSRSYPDSLAPDFKDEFTKIIAAR